MNTSINDEEEENFIHIYKLVVGVGTEAVRNTFDGLFLPTSLVATLKKEEMNLRRLGKKKRLTAKQLDILFPSSGPTSSKVYDISLMVCLIRNLVSVSPPINGFDTLPLITETSMGADLARIKYYRNEVAHADSDKIATIDFQAKWQDLVHAIIRLGGTKYKNVCDELEQAKLSKNCITDLRQQIAKLQEETRDNVQQLRQDIDNKIETEVGKMDEILQDSKIEIIAKLDKLEREETQLFTNMTNIDITQHKLKESVSGLECEKIEANKRLLEIKKEQDNLRSKLDESKIQNHDVGIKIEEIRTDQQELQKQIGILHAIQYKATESEIAGKEEVKGIKAEINTFKEDKEQIINKLEKLEVEQEDPVPRNIREQVKRRIDEWKIKNIKFIRTRAKTDVLAKISSNSCVAVTGSSGSGKSAIVRHVSLLLYEESGFDIIIVSNPMELKNYYKPGRKTLFVLEDVCGKFTANKRQIDDWISMIDVLNQVMADDLCKILLSCRLQVYKDAKFSEIDAFKTCECNITSEELCLTINEKKKFVKTYLNLDNIKVDILSRKNDMFPFLCALYLTEKEDVDIEKYFNTPYRFYQKELEALRINGTYKLCGLCLCVLFNNQLKESYFVRLTKKFRKIVKDTCEYCGLSKETSAIGLKDELDTLEKSYISKHDGVYEVYHDKLFDFMAYYFGQMMTQCFIDHADSAFLRERFLWEKAIDTEEHWHVMENIVSLKDEFLQSYIDRMISDWSNGKVSDVFYNINMRSPSFREEFLKGLNGIGEIQATKMSNMKDVFRVDFASGNTPLIISCVDGYVDLLNWLLEHKANVNERRQDGSSALYMACQKNYGDVVNILLQNNVDVNLCTEEGVSPLGIACFFQSNLQIISELLKKNAEVNKYRFKENNMTPLFMACRQNFTSAVEELLKHGADPDICLHDGMSVLLYACQNRYTEIVSLLVQYKANPNSEMLDGDTPLFAASRMGFRDIAELLLENGANFHKCLHNEEAIAKSLEETESLENEKQAWFDDVKSFGSDAIAAYIENKSVDYVFGVFAGSSPLHVACFMGHIEICRLLTGKLSSVDIRKEDGTTPLFYACELGHLVIVRVLLEKGANPKIQRDDLSSPLTIAEVNGHTDVLSLLTKY
ncbi:uncharacterized protein LOC127710651 isoform X2 [Mytilus californianus]|uniref:uncharacterized protein LOC127710651 isoform X2 n=1 Tax=Mytilus californianus TaxID=6549 RepID=UPI002246C359|nr:uncharacterized protein LOC127710651 isoform X2 [Mytilus californianus]